MKALFATICLMGLSLVAFGQTIIQVEYFLDVDAGFGKNTLRKLTPSADGPSSFTIDVSAALAGYHILYMRTKDSSGQWSHTTMRNVEVFKNQAINNVASVEYVFDTDPGVGKAAAIMLATPQPDGTLAFVIPKDKTTPGAHILYVRASDSPNRNWSLTQWKPLTIVNCTPPNQPAALASQTVCSANTVLFTVLPVAQATSYRWTVPTNWTLVSGQGTGSVSLKAPTVTQTTAFTTLSVAAVNECDAGPPRFFSATVNALPVTPVITATGTLLTSSSADGNQWFLNGRALGSATGPTYQPLTAGQYTVQVTQNGCSSPPSVGYQFVVTAVDDPAITGIQVFPNPVTTFLTVIIADSQPAQLQLYSMSGQLVLTSESITGTRQINTEKLASGCYILWISHHTKISQRFLLKR